MDESGRGELAALRYPEQTRRISCPIPALLMPSLVEDVSGHTRADAGTAVLPRSPCAHLADMHLQPRARTPFHALLPSLSLTFSPFPSLSLPIPPFRRALCASADFDSSAPHSVTNYIFVFTRGRSSPPLRRGILRQMGSGIPRNPDSQSYENFRTLRSEGSDRCRTLVVMRFSCCPPPAVSGCRDATLLRHPAFRSIPSAWDGIFRRPYQKGPYSSIMAPHPQVRVGVLGSDCHHPLFRVTARFSPLT